MEQRVLPGTGVPAERFWSGLDSIVATLGPRNEALLRQRDAKLPMLVAEVEAITGHR